MRAGTVLKRILAVAAIVSATLWWPPTPVAQEREDRTLLSWDEMRAIIDEASGERAMHHILELVPYPRVRPLDEYQGHFRESEVMARFAREYGYTDVEIESFPSPGRLWQPTQAELWMVEPERRKLYDAYDVAVSIAANSESGDVTAEVVDVGVGARAEDYTDKDVGGKIVLGSSGAGTLQRLGVIDRGAVGVVSYNSLRPDSYPDQIPSQSVAAGAPPTEAGQSPSPGAGQAGGRRTGFGWSIAPRVAREIADLVGRGQKVVLRSIVRAETFPGELEVVHATIRGDASSGQDVIVSGHLYEGYLKQGANDDNSGCAVTLEMGRAYIRLVKEGKLPPPRRTIHFLWVPEISGTNAWLNAHKDIEHRLVADLNFDMEGVRLSTSHSFFVLHRTPDTFPTFLNDVAQSVIEFVHDLNRERVRYRANGYRFTRAIVAPNGSEDPFYIQIEKHYGASDHVTYMQHGIPSVMFITWPDMWYHSSQDTPDKLDPTQFKRVAVVGVAGISVLASAGDAMGAKIAAESLARGTGRMGESERKGLGYLADVTSADALTAAYKEARNAVRHQAGVERAVVRSAAVLFTAPADAEKTLTTLAALVDQRAAALQNEVTGVFKVQAERMKAPAGEPTPTAEEKLAARLVVARIPRSGPGGGFGGGGAFGGGQAAASRRIPQHMTAEVNILLGQNKTALEIRDFLSGEFEPLPLADLMEYLRAQEKAGAVKLTEKAEEKSTPPARRRSGVKGS